MYMFGENTMKSFIEYHNVLKERKRSTVDNDLCGILSKAKGQSMHLETTLHVTDYCIKSASNQLDNTNWLSLQVGEDSMNCSTIVMNHLINVKHSLSTSDV